MSTRGQGLSPRLKSLVGEVEAVLGQVIAAAEGQELFEAVERVRRHMVRVRDGGARAGERALGAADAELRALSPAQRSALARAYTVYLELVNICENAYRTHRLRRRAREAAQEGQAAAVPAGRGARVIYVLTAHPTESRAPQNIALMHRAQDLLIEALDAGRPLDRDALLHALHLVWRTGTHPRHKPTVADEAGHLFSLVDDDVLLELLHLQQRGHLVLLRTWVGGDKDGHPGVGPEETAASLELSRARLLEFIDDRVVPAVARDVALQPDPELERLWRELREGLQALRRVTIGDGRRLTLFRAALLELSERYRRQRGAAHPRLEELGRLLFLFPGLVIPVELREERGHFGRGAPIAQMLHLLGDVARGGEVEWYVRGLVVSMTDAAEDLLAARDLVAEVLGGPRVPIVPLFEMPDVLPRATEILTAALAAGPFCGALPGYDWDLEVMLGYSDTSKRMGVLASRLAIHDAMQELGRWADARGLRVLFFHGSGGSEGRGGGTIEERFATWPAGACAIVKETLQGEMVERTLATPEILRSQVEKIAAAQAAPPRPGQVSELTRQLAARARETFVEVVSDRDFLALLAAATPYARLGALNIGSRPSKRGGGAVAGLESLRAIPWVLCWTQTRYLLHAWVGTGTAWRELRARKDGRAALGAAIDEDPLLRSYLRTLGFTLAKTAAPVWRAYAATLAPEASGPLLTRLERERQDALDLATSATREGELLSYRPWLKESIYYRAPMIHPLNLLQIAVLERKRLSAADELLFRETVTGVAAGMLTTG
ncbi:MAG: phosphoenolpyruvate carboxylase [Planctomycetota bacterium]